ncbi:MAG TPA: signal peptide prediction [Ramlibacter sp.]|uniref:signal peptide prediction n=1 Tax=Ramlibacter sp. TaxID=1917967 RepID=UPI002D7E46B2|nr:signal peptide prediction [Ramlibacter sp.]HET8746276.1 signal peptide prediction [Ramlibacter sp.]
MVTALRLFRYAWAVPNTLLGLVLGGVAVLSGATVRRHHGVIEIYGGRTGAAVARLPRALGFSAMTLGHVILAVDRSTLAQLRRHEHVHVRQYERWGPLFLPAYLLSSVLQLLRGRNPYRENHFERQAYALAPARRRAPAAQEPHP